MLETKFKTKRNGIKPGPAIFKPAIAITLGTKPQNNQMILVSGLSFPSGELV